MSFFDDAPAEPARRPPMPPPGPSPRSRALAITAVVMVVLFFLLSSFTGIWTDRLWFNSLGFGDVFTKILGTRVLLFVVFGVLFGGFVFANIVVAYRMRPLFRPASPEQANLDRYREAVEPIRKWIAIGVAVVLALFAGGSAAGEWRNFLMWRHSKDFGVTDPYFDRDIGFFIFQLPWLHYMVNVAMTAIVIGLIAAGVTHYLFGGVRLQAKGDKLSGAAQVQLSVLLGLFVLFKAADYWLDRFDLTTDQGRRFTGINYTAQNAHLPAKNILMFIAIICAVLFFANVLRRTWMLPTIGLGLLVVSAILLGVIWPGIVWQFQVSPSEPDKEAPFLSNNIVATRSAYGVTDVQEEAYPAAATVSPEALEEVGSLPGIRLIDPALVNQTFENLQQVRGYYSVPPVLDVDRYEINGITRDVVLTVRELELAGLPAEQQNWANQRTVYTHGYGVIAAFGNNRNAEDQEIRNPDPEEPYWAEEGLPANGPLSDSVGDYEQRIYFGEKSPTYSIVGQTDGGTDVELSIPSQDGAAVNTTYEGADGVGVGNIFNKLLYAIKFGEPNIVLSNRVGGDSKIIYDRNPRDRVEKVAPWLTVDDDPYPAIVDGRVLWIVDGYTMTDRYPNAERRSLSDMTSDALSPETQYVTLPTDQINYVRNSVKATVDAYDGTVTLYEWDADPMLEVWKEVFPDAITPKSEISEELMEHLRYPEDMFKVQRDILAQYHVTDPQDFYQGSDRWQVPPDPADSTETTKQPPYRLSVEMPAGDPAPGEEVPPTTEPQFSLTSVYTPSNRKNLASFIAVDSEASSDTYGQMRILNIGELQRQGPSQMANIFAADSAIQAVLQPLKLNSQIINGNLLTLPVAGGLLYVQPVYALQERADGSFPVLNYVMASFGQTSGIGRTLSEALEDLSDPSATPIDPPVDPENPEDPEPTPEPTDPPVVSDDVLGLLQQIVQLQNDADAALRDGDLVEYAQLQDQIKTLTQQAVDAAEAQE